MTTVNALLKKGLISLTAERDAGVSESGNERVMAKNLVYEWVKQ
jgi:hypothetical protein